MPEAHLHRRRMCGVPHVNDATQPPPREYARRRPRGLGAWGEDYACRFLESAGMRILERNWTCSAGEIDVIAMDGDVVVAVEVKTRRDNRLGSALEAVTPAKVVLLRRLVVIWLHERPQFRRGRSVRIDAIGITRPAAGATSVIHVRGVE